jgi:hypothetical protein
MEIQKQNYWKELNVLTGHNFLITKDDIGNLKMHYLTRQILTSVVWLS